MKYLIAMLTIHTSLSCMAWKPEPPFTILREQDINTTQEPGERGTKPVVAPIWEAFIRTNEETKKNDYHPFFKSPDPNTGFDTRVSFYLIITRKGEKLTVILPYFALGKLKENCENWLHVEEFNKKTFQYKPIVISFSSETTNNLRALAEQKGLLLQQLLSQAN